MFGMDIKTSGVRAALEKWAKGLTYAAEVAVVDATTAAKESAIATIRATTTRRTGALEDRWEESWRGPFKRALKNTSGHDVLIDRGTKPHRIEARTRRGKQGVLAFQVAGSMVFRRAVNHPGTKPRPFFALAQAAGQMALRASAEAAVNHLANSF